MEDWEDETRVDDSCSEGEGQEENKVGLVLSNVRRNYESRGQSTGESPVEVDEIVVNFFLEEAKGNVERATELVLQQLAPPLPEPEPSVDIPESGRDGAPGRLTTVTWRRQGRGDDNGDSRGAEGSQVRPRGTSGRSQRQVHRAFTTIFFLCFKTIGKVVSLSVKGLRASLIFVTKTTRLVLNLVVPSSLAAWLNRMISVSRGALSGQTIVDPTEAASHFVHHFVQEYCPRPGPADRDLGASSEGNQGLGGTGPCASTDPSSSASAANAAAAGEGAQPGSGAGAERACPEFEVCGHYESLSRARTRSRFLVCYLHSPEHADCRRFCAQVLTSPVVVDFLRANFVVWGGDVTRSRDAYGLSQALGVSKYPALAVLTSASIIQNFGLQQQHHPGLGGSGMRQDLGPSSGMALVCMSEGALSGEGLVELLQGVLEDSGPMLVAARAEQEEREASRRIREEQERDFALALAEDQRKERERMEVQEREREAERVQEESRRRLEEKNEAVVQRRRQRSETVPEEPPPGSENVAKIMVRFPDGARTSRRFLNHDKVGTLVAWVDSLEANTSFEYKLVTNFPRKVFDETTFSQTLEEAGLSPQGTLFLQSED